MIDISSEQVLASGLVEKIGLDEGNLSHKTFSGGDKPEEHRITEQIQDHTEALNLVMRAFRTWGPSLDDVVAVGHRVVHGGDRFSLPTIINDEVKQTIAELSGLAPLHNPPGLAGINAAQAVLPDVPHVAIFDTAFFSTLPPEAYTYAIDRDLAEQYHIRKYGFHGTSHAYISRKAPEFMGCDPSTVNQIICHLGNGASISAVEHGKAIETSMGLTPLPGLVMGTRSGDIDPAVFPYLERSANLSTAEVDDLLNKRSGMAGLADGSSDFRDLWAKIDAGDTHAALAMDVYVHRLVSYIGSYLALLGHTDWIVFTAGVGENDNRSKARVIERLGGFGIKLDPELNTPLVRQPKIISAADSTVKVLVIPTNEELAMARDTYQVIR